MSESKEIELPEWQTGVPSPSISLCVVDYMNDYGLGFYVHNGGYWVIFSDVENYQAQEEITRWHPVARY
jgi:hypothetical protein